VLAGSAFLGMAALTAASAQTQLVWSVDSGTEGWLPRTVSIGNEGTQVFTRVGPFYDHARVYSAHDANPPTPVWARTETHNTYKHKVASAELTDLHVSIHEEYVGGTSGPKRPIVEKLTTSSGTLDWSYTIPTDHYGNELSEVFVSEDGVVIVAVSYDLSATFDPRVVVFTPNSSVPIANSLVSTVGAPDRVLLSGDGSTLYIWGGSRITIVDIPSLQTIWTGAIFDEGLQSGHAISYDGRTIAFGAGNGLRIYERQGSNYVELHRYYFPSDFRCEAVDLSRDGSKLAAGANASFDNLTVQIVALKRNLTDSTQPLVVTMLNEQEGQGTYANIVSHIAMAADGSTFAVGLWGDEDNTIPEVQFFDSRQNEPIGTHDLPGSVMALDLSDDGKRAAVAAKATHANVFAGGGSVSLFEARPVDFRVSGVPHPGAMVEFELHAPGPQPSAAVLLSANQLATTPETFPNSGTLYLPRSTMDWTSMGMIQNGTARLSMTIPAGMEPGSTVYYQGLRTQGRQLSKDWVALTVVP
jgi:WD40 repeat protein